MRHAILLFAGLATACSISHQVLDNEGTQVCIDRGLCMDPGVNTPPPGMEGSCYDGCNWCFCSDDGELMSCTARLCLDGGLRFDAGLPADAAAPIDAGAQPVSCNPQRVSSSHCATCRGADEWAWDGSRCISMPCGSCTGDDCDSLYLTEAACLGAHAECDARLCESTGGEWLFHAEECGHRVCGEVSPLDCLIGGPVCDCGGGQVFEEGTGCVTPRSGCEPRPGLPPDVLCENTGGEWGPFCSHSRCGVPSADDCAAMACHCPDERQIFNETFGCADAPECFERRIGDSCERTGDRCENGGICCTRHGCGGAGCPPDLVPECLAPRCDDPMNYDVCNNCLTCP